uniref:4-hydroxyphenylpyruvate dioxygenase n=1 Tax=Rhizophora mucronata TaxID=61149 RepID=A0A2P2NH38_RHIMU
MFGREIAASLVVEAGNGGSSGVGEVLHDGNRGRVRSGEEEAEVAGPEEVGSVGDVTGGEIGFGNDCHAEPPRKTTRRVGGIVAPEIHVVEPLHLEPV